MSETVAVLGAGMVGVSSALALQRRGFAVTLIDRREPGRETSYGNAGVISRGSFVPFNEPSLFGKLAGFVGNKKPAFRYSASYVASQWPWLLRFLSYAGKADTERRTVALHALITPTLSLHLALAKEAGIAHRMRETGTLKLWRSDGRPAAEAERALMERFGLAAEVLDRQGISGLEPGLRPIYQVGLWKKDTASVDSPGEVVKAYAGLFVARGGTIERAEAMGLAPVAEGWQMTVGEEHRSFRHVVVALGPWSADLLKPLGYRVPLNFERGYHQEFAAPTDGKLIRPFLDADCAFYMTPVEKGIRVTTGVEFAHRDAPSNYGQIELAVPRAREALPFGAAVAGPWRGARPTLPDSLPMIGRAPRHEGLWLAFGHQHIGFSTGPSTGEALAALIAGETPLFDIAPFAPSRFI